MMAGKLASLSMRGFLAQDEMNMHLRVQFRYYLVVSRLYVYFSQ